MISSKTFLWLRLSTFVVLACIVTQIASAQVFDPPVLLSTEPFSSNEIDQDSPALMVRGDTVYVVWSEFRLNGDPPPDPAGMYATLARWNVGGNPSANIIGLLPPDTLPTEPGIVGRMFLRGSYDGYSTDSLLVRGIVTTQADRFDNGSGPDTLYRTQLMLHFAEPDGWRKVKIAEMRSTEKSVELDTRGYGFWENFLVAWQVQGEPTGTVTALDRSGDVAWSVQNIPMPGTGTMTILPYHTDEFLLINGNTGIFYNGSEPIGTLTFTSSGTHTQYLRLDHDHFVRGHFSETTQRYRLERYDFQGNLSESVESNIDDPDADYTMTLIHSFDPVVAFVSAGPAGVWGEYFAGYPQLRRIREPFQIYQDNGDVVSSPAVVGSSPPGSGGSYTDSLYIAWESDRGTGSDIYGTRGRSQIMIDTAVDEPGVEPRRVDIGTIAPNPATQFVSVEVALPFASTVAIELIDVAGRVAYRQETDVLPEGDRFFDVPLTDLQPGTYTIAIRAGELTATGRVTVVR